MALLSFVSAACNDGNRSDDDGGELTLTIFHNNDCESKLVNAGEGLEDFGGKEMPAAKGVW